MALGPELLLLLSEDVTEDVAERKSGGRLGKDGAGGRFLHGRDWNGHLGLRLAGGAGDVERLSVHRFAHAIDAELLRATATLQHPKTFFHADSLCE